MVFAIGTEAATPFVTEQELDEDFKPVPSTQLADANAFDLGRDDCRRQGAS
jgi:hypothetical protein